MRKVLEIRKKTGLSQYELADLLGVSRSSILMYESNQRFLPTEAMIQLGRFQHVYYNIQQDKAAELTETDLYASKENKASVLNKLKGKVEVCMNKAAVLQDELKEMQLQYGSLQWLLFTFHTLLMESFPIGMNPVSKKWLELKIFRLKMEMVAYSRDNRFLIQHKIDCLIREANAHQEAYELLANEIIG